MDVAHEADFDGGRGGVDEEGEGGDESREAHCGEGWVCCEDGVGCEDEIDVEDVVDGEVREVVFIQV